MCHLGLEKVLKVGSYAKAPLREPMGQEVLQTHVEDRVRSPKPCTLFKDTLDGSHS